MATKMTPPKLKSISITMNYEDGGVATVTLADPPRVRIDYTTLVNGSDFTRVDATIRLESAILTGEQHLLLSVEEGA